MKRIAILFVAFFAIAVGSANAQMPGGSMNGDLYMNGNTIHNATIGTGGAGNFSSLTVTGTSQLTGVVSAGSGPTTVTTSTGTIAAGALANQSSVASFYKNIYANGEGATNSTSVADYWPLQGVFTPQAVANLGLAETQVPVVTYHNLFCTSVNAGGTATVPGTSANYTIAVDDVTQTNVTVTCQITAAITACSDTTHSFTTTANDLVAMIATPSGTPTALAIKCTLEADY